MDVREASSEKINTIYQEFKKFKPEVTWYDGRAYLRFKNEKGQKFSTNSIYLEHYNNDVKCEFTPNVDNLRFDGDLVFTDEIRKELSEFIKHGISKDPLDYIIKTNN